MQNSIFGILCMPDDEKLQSMQQKLHKILNCLKPYIIIAICSSFTIAQFRDYVFFPFFRILFSLPLFVYLIFLMMQLWVIAFSALYLL
jgi:hypothetical protein